MLPERAARRSGAQAAGRGRGRRRVSSRSRRCSRRTSSWTTLAGRCANGRGTAYRCRCISVLLSLIRKGSTEGRAVGAESRRSLHLVVCRVPYAMSRDGCRPLLCAAADSNRHSPGPGFTQARSIVAWDCSSSGCCRPGTRPTATLRAHPVQSVSVFAQFAACSATSSSRRSRASSSTVRRSWATSTVAVILISRSE